MKSAKHTKILRRRRLPTGAIVLLLAVTTSALSAWTYYDATTIPTGAYQLNYPANFGNRVNTPDDNPTTKQGVFLGRLLFYEPLLSADNSVSCSSCHKQELAFTDGVAFSRGVHGARAARNSMSLANLLWARKFFWDGRASSLEEQASFPLVNPVEMGQPLDVSIKKLKNTTFYPAIFKQVYGDTAITTNRMVKALAQFERTLISANSKYDRYLANNYQPTDDELKGMTLFNTFPDPEKGIRGANCSHCHGGPKNYLELFHNNGLDSISKDEGIGAFTKLATDRGRFKVPTLRNIALTAPYMHDGRFKTLNEVLDHYSEHVAQSPALSAFLQDASNIPGGRALKLTAIEKKQLIAFLNMLTDTTFTADARFADPFISVTKHQLKKNLSE
ncbi:cytochrome c peroxidase [Mucilaginibacter yixingensis]|uniref:Cytochrome c peroxidase n=1 Tax=Mucilaginibacter yixingensis TaxID=1295612 RepID=A0A2T5JA13_9SPHI|nr:cytochrome c peroxidase [Mucilaginibacter yixingensis]PTQ96906.1 cytochrome c peroxidase [Mucilaginibacter yixingensis]